jgi:hypothetical protein
MKTTGIVLIALVVFISGCGPKTPEPLYNYGNYSNSYYSYKKNMTPDSTQQLQKSIEEAIEDSGESQSRRVPPGMYANLGYLQLKAGKNQNAIENFTKEKTTYPESTFFMDKLIKRTQDSGENKK